MFRRLMANTLVSAVAYFAVSLIGILLTPFLLSAYGLAAFGLITLARLFLPTGVLSIADLGLSDISSLATARAREDGLWARCARQLTFLSVFAFILGLIACAIVVGFAAVLPRTMEAPAELLAAFTHVMLVTAAVTPVLFLALLAEGVLKGFERFATVRFLEVSSNLAYGGLALIAIQARLSYEAVCYAYLATQVARGAIAMPLAWRALARQGLKRSRWAREDRDEILARSKLIVHARILGSLQTQVPPLLIAFIVGAAGAGIYDVLTKLPRFMKSVLGMINSTLLPVAVRLDTAANAAGLARLGEIGLLILALVMLSTVPAAMSFSADILRLWIGPDLAAQWAWQSLMFLHPLLMGFTSFGANSLVARIDVLKKLNMITTAQVALQFGISLALAPVFQERAFILGHIASLCITFLPTMRTIVREQKLSGRIYLWLLQSAILSGVLAAAAWYWLQPSPNLVYLAASMALWVAIAAPACLLLMPNRDERGLLLRLPKLLVEPIWKRTRSPGSPRS